MSQFIKGLISKKIKELTSEELLYYGKQYGFSLSKSQANNITSYIKSHSLDPFDANDRMKMLQDLTRMTDADTAKKAQNLFIELIQSYGLGHLFY